MSYQVRWRPQAETDLISEWIRTARKNAMTGYIDQIEKILARNPAEQGETRTLDKSVRIWFYRPLCVLFEIDAAKSTVWVMRIRWIGL
jgi:hypothetical protein